jgi:para-nitrobenzyl esterase
MTIEVKTGAGVVSSAEPDDHIGVHSFLGVPYAASPTGRDHLGAPRPPDPWDGVRRCESYGATAPQPAQGFTIVPEPIIVGDNCLNLNVFTPDIGAAAALPVLVWIHGGAFVNGCNASPWYHGRSFARDGAVVVAVNYRLGIEGFLPLEDAPANRAVLDWLAALEWVQDNVAAFGGDPNNVTIGGQSAGAMACATLLAVPRAVGLFGRAILMSGAANHLRDLDEAGRYAERVANELGVAPTREAFGAVAPSDLVNLQERMGWYGGDDQTDDGDMIRRFLASTKDGLRFGPLIDGDLVPEAPLTALTTMSRSCEVLVGTTAAETVAMARFAGDLSEDTVLGALRASGMSTSAATGYRAAHAEETPAGVLGHAMTDAAFRVPAVRVAEARQGMATYAYEFQWVPPTGFGSVHCLDIPFGFDLLEAPAVEVVAGDAPPQQLADDVHGAWMKFLRSGDPGWPPYDVETRRVMAFDAPTSSIVVDPHAACRERFAGKRV